MPKYFLNILLLFFLAVDSYLTTNLIAQENYLITDIEFSGNESISSDELLDNMFSTPTNWFERSILGIDPSYYESELFQEDLQNIIRLYQRRGFLKVKIDSTTVLSDEKSLKTILRVVIDEGDPVVVKNVRIFLSKNQEIDARKDSIISLLQENMAIKTSEIFADANLLIDEKNFMEFFSNSGYPHTKVKYSLSISQEENFVDLLWEIDAGPLSRFGEITFSGYERTSEDLLRRKLNFYEGDIYDAGKISESQQSLYNLGLFYVATFKSFLSENRENDIIPIEVIIKEVPLFRAEFGIGYGRDEKLRISTNLKINGPFGAPSKINIEAKHSALDALKLSFIYANMDFLKLNTILRVKTSFRRQTEPAFEAERKGIDVALLRNLWFDIYGSIMLNFENVNQDTTTISYVNNTEGFQEDYNKTGITFGLNLNASSPFFNPATGFQTSLVFSYMGITPNSEYNYTFTMFELRKYFTIIRERVIFAYKFNIGALNSLDEHQFIPIEDRFFSGGSNSIRGWSRSLLGPLDSNGKPIGGNSILENSAEIRLKFTQKLGMVAFLDFGNVWLQKYTYPVNDMRYAAGMGFRYSTPIGPIRLDFALPVFEGKAKVQYWFSVGQAF